MVFRAQHYFDVVFPITLDEWQGHCWLEDLGKEIVLQSLRTEATVLLKAARPLIFTRVPASDLCIRQNFSAERASVIMQNININCLALFAPIEGSLRTLTLHCAPSACNNDVCAWEVAHLSLEHSLPSLRTPQTDERALCLWRLLRTKRRRQGGIRSFSKVRHSIRSTSFSSLVKASALKRMASAHRIGASREARQNIYRCHC